METPETIPDAPKTPEDEKTEETTETELDETEVENETEVNEAESCTSDITPPSDFTRPSETHNSFWKYGMLLLIVALAVGFTEFKIYQFGGSSPITGLSAGLSGLSIKNSISQETPTGTPWYGKEAGVSFDNAKASIEQWAKYDGGINGKFYTEGVTIKTSDLNPDAQERYNKLINAFTCDFCCAGRPIANCACTYAVAWRGMFKFFLKNYENKLTDEELMKEAALWKSAWSKIADKGEEC